MGGGKLERAGSDAFREGPLDGRRLTGVAGIGPVDVPVLFQREREADLQSAAGSDLRGEGNELDGEVLGLEGPGGAVADFFDLGGSGEDEEEEKGSEGRKAVSGCGGNHAFIVGGRGVVRWIGAEV
jgi:hypothetical protein